MFNTTANSTLLPNTNCIVLISGGMDSAACVHFYKAQQYTVSGLHISYGQPSVRQEITAAKAVSHHYRIPLTILKVSGARPKPDGEVIGRNAFLIFLALTEIKNSSSIIALGIHAGVPYYDCSFSFLEATQDIIDAQCSGQFRVTAPFIDWSKEEIWKYCLEHRVPIELTYSCERGLKQPCGICLSCRDL